MGEGDDITASPRLQGDPTALTGPARGGPITRVNPYGPPGYGQGGAPPPPGYGAPPPGFGGPPPPGFGAPGGWGGGPYGYGPPPPPQSPSSQAITALVLAIVSWIGCGCLTGLPAVFIARSELASIDRGESSPAGKGLAQAAFWIGIVNTVLYAIVVVIYMFVFMLGAAGGFR